MGKRKYVKRKMGANPLVFSFRQKSNPDHIRMVRGHHMDDTPLSWAVHTRVVTPGRNYIRHITEWFEKSLWATAEPKVKRRRAYTESKPFVAPVASVTPPEDAPAHPPRPTRESPKNEPPPITLVDDEDDTEEIPVAAVIPVKAAPKSDPFDINAEMPGEYNPRAHKEKVAGDPEDLVVFDALVDSNFIAQQRRNKLAALRAREQGRVLRTTPNNPIVSGFEPG
jgi:hypothetical protein